MRPATCHSLAKITVSSIDLIYILTKDNKDKVASITKLAEIAAENEKKTGIATIATAEEGDIFTTIGKITADRKAWYLCFGTHGVKGMQHIMGAFALKVVSSSDCPVIIVQRKPLADYGFKNILLPIDGSKITKQKVFQAIALAKLYQCNIHLFAAEEKDEQFVINRKGNVFFVKDRLAENGLKLASETMQDTSSKESLSKQIIKFASSNSIDLILTMTEEPNALGAIFAPEDVKIVNNDAQIPVMCINPVNFGIMGSIISFGGFS